VVAPGQRRERGEGAILYDESKDRWVGQLDLGTDAHSRRRRPKVSGRTRAEVRTKLDQLRTAEQGRPSRRPTQPVSGERLTSVKTPRS